MWFIFPHFLNGITAVGCRHHHHFYRYYRYFMLPRADSKGCEVSPINAHFSAILETLDLYAMHKCCSQFDCCSLFCSLFPHTHQSSMWRRWVSRTHTYCVAFGLSVSHTLRPSFKLFVPFDARFMQIAVEVVAFFLLMFNRRSIFFISYFHLCSSHISLSCLVPPLAIVLALHALVSMYALTFVFFAHSLYR